MLSSLAATATKTVRPFFPGSRIALNPLERSQKKIAPMMEAFFQAHVLPEFKSPHGFLRYRVRRFSLLPQRTGADSSLQACEVVEKFESCDMDWDRREVRSSLLAEGKED